MKTLLIDNYDSFTFNLYQQIAEVNGMPPIVVKNDAHSWAEISQLDFDNIVISPGPGRPEVAEDFGICAEAILEATVPVLGVCLGHQGMCHLFGGKVDYAEEVMHGRPSQVFHTGEDTFQSVPSPFSAIRYHSLLVAEVPESFEAIAWTDDNIVMGVRHKEKPLWGVQFHPESICTENGHQLLANFARLTNEYHAKQAADGKAVDRSAAIRIEAVETSQPGYSKDRFQPMSEATLHGKAFDIYCRRVPFEIDAEGVFLNHFENSKHAFWLDSALVRGFSRFSYMGDASGPHAEFVSYDLPEKRVSVTRRGQTETFNESIFTYLERMLKERHKVIEGLPFEFNLGYVGYLGYELKADCSGSAAHKSPTPDAGFVFADRMIVFDHEEKVSYLICLDDVDNADRANAWLDEMWDAIRNLRPVPVWSRTLRPQPIEQHFRHTSDEYLELIKECQDEISRGESYEICLTNMITHYVDIDPLNTYRALRASNPAPYATYLHFGDLAVLSSSPERFITVDSNGLVESKPIKGTRKRGGTPDEDEALYQDLRSNEKDRSENLMIVDLLRNDIGMVSDVGSVHVAHMFAVESYATVHQLVSTVRGKLRKGTSAVKCVQAAFPGGSMTGAPKVRTMEIIDRLEAGPRGIYSGGIGFFGLNGSADLSITIRTIVVTPEDVTVGVGGAIVALSDPQEEVEEMLLKSRATVKALSETTLTRSEPAAEQRAAELADSSTA